MPVYKPNSFKEFWSALREWLPGARSQAVEAWETIREEPAQVWNSPIFRWSMIALGGLVLVMTVRFSANMLLPKLPPGHKTLSKTANFEIICSNPACNHRFLINRPFGYDDFPVKCPKCAKETGQRALRCDSKFCRGQYVLPVQEGDSLRCSRCGAALHTER